MSEVGDKARDLLLEAIEMRVNQQTPPESLRDLAQACRELNVRAGHPVVDKILTELQYRATKGTAQNIRTLAQAWAMLQPSAPTLDLVADDASSHEHGAPIG
jgi:hypothetical protein